MATTDSKKMIPPMVALYNTIRLTVRRVSGVCKVVKRNEGIDRTFALPEHYQNEDKGQGGLQELKHRKLVL